MTTESAIAFAERLKSDEAFRNQFIEATSPDVRTALVTEAGYDLSPEDAPTIRSTLGTGELSDEDLEKVAGGMPHLREFLALRNEFRGGPEAPGRLD